MDVFENLALLMIVKREVSEQLDSYYEKIDTLSKLKNLLTFRSGNSDLPQVEEVEDSYSSVLYSSQKNGLSSESSDPKQAQKFKELQENKKIKKIEDHILKANIDHKN